jgi:hypothetical protein
MSEQKSILFYQKNLKDLEKKTNICLKFFTEYPTTVSTAVCSTFRWQETW